MVFANAWEQRKFSEIATRRSDSAISSNLLPSVEYEDIVSSEGILNKDLQNKKTGRKGLKFSPSDILFGKLRPYLHNWLKPSFPGVAIGDFWVFAASKNVDPDFLYCLIQSPKYDAVANLSSGSKMPRSDWQLVSNAYFLTPRQIDEQIKVAATFRNIESSIVLHQRE